MFIALFLGEKPHVCDVCSKGFSTSSSLNTHRRIHSGEKPHQCPICGKRFTASSNLYYHRMTHNKVCMRSKEIRNPAKIPMYVVVSLGILFHRKNLTNVCSVESRSRLPEILRVTSMFTADPGHTLVQCVIVAFRNRLIFEIIYFSIPAWLVVQLVINLVIALFFTI